jgi:hypothetical protein
VLPAPSCPPSLPPLGPASVPQEHNPRLPSEAGFYRGEPGSFLYPSPTLGLLLMCDSPLPEGLGEELVSDG